MPRSAGQRLSTRMTRSSVVESPRPDFVVSSTSAQFFSQEPLWCPAVRKPSRSLPTPSRLIRAVWEGKRAGDGAQRGTSTVPHHIRCYRAISRLHSRHRRLHLVPVIPDGAGRRPPWESQALSQRHTKPQRSLKSAESVPGPKPLLTEHFQGTIAPRPRPPGLLRGVRKIALPDSLCPIGLCY
jgi:hypothetical protein